MFKKKSIIVCAVLAFLLSVSIVYAETSLQDRNLCFSTKWPHEMSDLKPDPRLIFGRLPNGFRYVLMKNLEPQNRVGMYLDVKSGSLNETEDQRGIAHFLEHMVFDGSTHFKPGELIDYFQSLGMSFGGDTNAQTGYNSTIYNLILPDGSKQKIEKGLLVFSDYAMGALLLPKQIDKERGVILSEKRSRDSAGFRTTVATSAFTFKGTLFPDRFPIGKADIIEKADHRLLESYYRAWYRPEDMILVMVGDFDPAQVEPLIKERFSSFVGKDARPVCPDLGKVNHAGLAAFYHYEPETGATKVSLETLWNEKEQNDSLALEIQDLKRDLATTILNHRLEKLAEDPKTPFTDGGYGMGTTYRRIGYGLISATAPPEKWRSALEVIEHTLRQALEFGFSDDELQRVKREFKSDLDSAVLTAATRNSIEFAREIISDLNENSVFQSAAQQKEIFEPIIDRITLSDVQKALSEVWAHGNRLVQVTGNAKITDKNPKALIKDVYTNSLKEVVRPKSAQEKIVFPYLKAGPKKVTANSDVSLPSIGAERLIFADGLVLNLKKTDFKKNVFAIRVDFGHGKQTEPVPGLAMLTQSVINGSGSGRLTESELERVLTGSTVDLHFQVNQSSFTWEGDAVTKDMELLFQVLQTMLVDPGIRADAYQKSMDTMKQMYSNLDRNINGGIALHVRRFLAGGYPHAGLPPWSEFSNLTLSQVRNWILPAISSSPLEISVVGDFNRDQLVTLVGKYLVSPGGRKKSSEPEAVILHFPKGAEAQYRVDSSIDKAIVTVAWPTADFWDIGRTRRLNMLASIFTDRLRKEVRETLGASYSPVVFNASSRVFPGYGLLQAMIIVDPLHIDQIKNVVLKIGDDLQKNGCTADELERAKAPTITSIKDMIRTNGYWLDTVLALSERHPQQLKWPTTILSDHASITTQDIAVLANEYLVRNRAAIAVIQPGKTNKAK
jgi:zinc protease